MTRLLFELSYAFELKMQEYFRKNETNHNLTFFFEETSILNNLNHQQLYSTFIQNGKEAL